MSSGDHADSIPLHKTPRTPDRELAQLSIDSAEKSSQLQRSSAEIQAASKHLFVGEDKHMDEDSGSDNGDFTTPPESDGDKEKDDETEEKLKNTHRPAARLAGNESQQKVEPSPEAYFPKPDEDRPQQDVQTSSRQHATRLVLRPSHNHPQSDSDVRSSEGSLRYKENKSDLNEEISDPSNDISLTSMRNGTDEDLSPEHKTSSDELKTVTSEADVGPSSEGTGEAQANDNVREKAVNAMSKDASKVTKAQAGRRPVKDGSTEENMVQTDDNQEESKKRMPTVFGAGSQTEGLLQTDLCFKDLKIFPVVLASQNNLDPIEEIKADLVEIRVAKQAMQHSGAKL